MLRVFVGLIIAIGCASIPWLAWRVGRGALVTMATLALLVMVIGAIVGAALYPASDLIVLAFALPGGILLGRALPARFRPFFVFLVALSVLDVVQVALTSGPPPGQPSASSGLNPHLIWVNFRIGLPAGHFNIGLVDLLLIAAMSEHFRRRDRRFWIAVLAGVIGIALAELSAAALGGSQNSVLGTLTQALIPFLTVGWLVADFLARRQSIPGGPRERRPSFSDEPGAKR